MNQYKFEKIFTRDTSMIIFEVWYSAFTDGTSRIFGQNPIATPIINYMHDGLTDIYESKSGMQWFRDRLLQINNRDKDFFISITEKYQEGIKKLKPIYNSGKVDSLDDFKSFLDKIEGLYIGFAFMFFTSIDDRNPSDLLQIAQDIRSKDTFFDDNDKVVRNTIMHLYPEIVGFEKAILRNELDNLPRKEILQERLKNFIFAPGILVDSITLGEFKRLHPQVDFLQNDLDGLDNVDEIRGSIAYPGYIKGLVRLVTGKDQIKYIQSGDIVVTHMTTPDFTISLKKASAIITDEGGITCHAAIISRELKKPCIIGTKVATEVLKDGMLVEVDAEKGIIRIIRQ